MAGTLVAELLEADAAIVSAEVLWVAPAIVVGWGIPTIAKAPAPAVVTPTVAVAPATTPVAPAPAVMAPAPTMATLGHGGAGGPDGDAAQSHGDQADAEPLRNRLHVCTPLFCAVPDGRALEAAAAEPTTTAAEAVELVEPVKAVEVELVEAPEAASKAAAEPGVLSPVESGVEFADSE